MTGRGRIIATLLMGGLFLSTLNLSGQELRWSQYYVVMPAINPAAVGAFGGDYRLITDYRMNNYSGATDPLTTIYASYDQGIKKHKVDGDAKNTFFSAGLSFLNDKAGAGALTTTEIGAMLSFNMKLAEGHFLGIGVKMSYGSKSVDYSGLKWSSQFDGADGTYDPTLPSDPLTQYEKVNYFPLSTGLMWNYADPDRLKMTAGFSLNALNQPDVAFDANSTEKLPMQIVGNVGADWYIPNTIISLMPLFLFQSRAYYSEINAGLIAKWHLSFDSKLTHIKKTSTLYTGFFYRNTGDIILSAKIDFRRDITFGLSYDMGMDGDETRGRSALELALIYRGFFKEKSMVPRMGDYEFFY